MDKMQKLMQLNGIKTIERKTATNEELEEAVLELAQNQADLEDALVEIAEMLAGGE